MRATLAILCGLMWLVGVAWSADSTRAEDAAQATPPTPVAAPAAGVSEAHRKTICSRRTFRLRQGRSDGFWPLFRDYRRDIDELQDQRANVDQREYAETFRTMTGDQAKAMLERSAAGR